MARRASVESGRTGPQGGVAAKVGRGRPQRFDRRVATEQAMRLFWERGYEGASFNELTKAMGMSASSLQNAFGGKEALFHEAVRHYSEGPSAWYARALAAPLGTRDTFRRLVADMAVGFTSPDLPAGCLVSTAAMQTAPDLAAVREFATGARRQSQQALAERIRRGIAEGDVPGDTDADALAAFFATVFRGMAVQARDGATRAELVRIGEHAMRTWPSGAPQAVAADPPAGGGSGPAPVPAACNSDTPGTGPRRRRR